MAKIYPDLFAPWMQEVVPKKNVLVQQGLVEVISSHPELSQSGEFFTRPIQEHIDNTGNTEQITTTTTLTLATLNDKQEQVAVSHQGKGWSEVELNNILRGANGLDQIASQVAGYWARQYQLFHVAAIKGATDALIATHEYDYTGIGDGRMDLKAVTGGKALLGETGEELDVLVVHTDVLYQLQVDGQIDYVNARTFADLILVEGDIPVFNGLRVVVNNTLCAPTTGVYPSYLVSSAAKPWWMGFQRQLRVETDRNILLGGGQDQVATYSDFAVTVKGMTWNVSVLNPEVTDLQTSTNWTQVGETENIKYTRVLTQIT